jgi:hypothetical protein
VPLLLLGPPFFPIILFGSTTLLTGMTGNSLHMQWPLTSQSHGGFSKREQLVIRYRSNSTPKVRMLVWRTPHDSIIWSIFLLLSGRFHGYGGSPEMDLALRLRSHWGGGQTFGKYIHDWSDQRTFILYISSSSSCMDRRRSRVAADRSEWLGLKIG